MSDKDRIKQLENEIATLTMRLHEICNEFQTFLNRTDNQIDDLNIMLFRRVWNSKFEPDPGRSYKYKQMAAKRKRVEMMPDDYMEIINEVVNLSSAIRREVKAPSKTLIEAAGKADDTIADALNMDFEELFAYSNDPDLLRQWWENITKREGDPPGGMPLSDSNPAPEKEMVQ